MSFSNDGIVFASAGKVAIMDVRFNALLHAPRVTRCFLRVTRDAYF